MTSVMMSKELSIFCVSFALLFLVVGTHGAFFEDVPNIIPLSNSTDYDATVFAIPCVWVVHFYSSVDCPLCISDAPAFAQAARSLAGVVGFAAVDCGDDEAYDFCSEMAVHRHPTTFLYSADIDGFDVPSATLRRARPADISNLAASAKTLINVILASVPDTCVRLKSTRDKWLSGTEYAKKPRLILFTAQNAAPPVLRGLTLEYAGRINVAVAIKNDSDDFKKLMEEFSVKSLPAARLLLPETKLSGASVRSLDNSKEEPLNGARLRTFVEPFGGDSLVKRFRDHWKVKHFENSMQWRKYCTPQREEADYDDEDYANSALGIEGEMNSESLCVLVTLTGEDDTFMHEFNVLVRLAVKYRGRVLFFYTTPTDNFDLTEEEEDGDSLAFAAAAFGPQGTVVKHKGIVITGDVMSDWLDDVLSGYASGVEKAASSKSHILRTLDLTRVPDNQNVENTVEHDEL